MTKANWGAIITLAIASFMVLILSSSTADAQDEPERPKGTRAKVLLLESQIDDMEKSLKDVYGANAPNYLRTRLTQLQDKLESISEKLVEYEEKSQEGKATGQERETRLDEVAQELKNLWKEVESQKNFTQERFAAPNAGYDDGFFVASSDNKFRLTLGGTFRPYYRFNFQEEWDSDAYQRLVPDEEGYATGGDTKMREHTFGLANARLIIAVKLFEFMRGVLEIDYGTLTGEVQYPINAVIGNARYNKAAINEHSLQLLDVYGMYAPMPEFNARIGQMKVPFDRETLIDVSGLTFTTRSLMSRSYPLWVEGVADDRLTFHWDYDMQRASSFGRDRGIELSGSVNNGIFKYSAGLFNGGGPNINNDNRDFLVAIRLSSDPLGEMTPGMSDLDTSKKPLLSIGAAFAYDLLEHKHALDPHLSYNSSDVNLTGDFQFKWWGVSVLASVFYRHADYGEVYMDAEGKEVPISSLGVVAQAAYFNEYTKLEPAFRYSMYDADMDRKRDHVHEITGAINYYVFGRNFKLQLEYRGLFAAQMDRTYLVPWGVWNDYLHEFTIGTQLAF